MIKNLAAVTLLAACAQAASAAPTTVTIGTLTTYFGENTNADGKVSGDPVTARTAFTGAVTSGSTTVETFETAASGPVTSLPVFSGGATLTPDGDAYASIQDTPGAPFGRFNTTDGGAKYYEGTEDFTVCFGSSSFSAFGFYGTDFGDFGASVSLQLLQGTACGTDVGKPLDIMFSDGGTQNSSLLFFGFTDTAVNYTGVRFRVTQSDPLNPDGLGFDDLIIGTAKPPNPAPEPGTLALVGASLLGLVAARRRRR